MSSTLTLIIAFAIGLPLLLLAGKQLRRTRLRPEGRHIVLVDGVCVFCNRLVSSIIRWDRTQTFHFAHIQSSFGRALLERHGRDPNDVDPIYLLANEGTPHEVLLIDGEAGREIWPRLFKGAALARLVPLGLLNLQYKLFAKVRYRLIGRYEQCHVPTASERARYLALDELTAEPRLRAGQGE